MSQVVLSLDTSTPVLSAALVRSEPGRTELLAHAEESLPAVTSTLVPSVFDKLLSSASLTLDNVDVLVTGLGPGLFTGVRVAVATMKAVAYARRKPLAGAESLEAMALSAARPPGNIIGGALPDSPLLCPCLDARKGEVYWATYRAVEGKLRCELPPRATTQSAMVEELSGLGQPVRVFGTGTRGLSSGTNLDILPTPQTPAAFETAALAMDRSVGLQFDPAAVLALEPFYLRPPEAEVARQKRALTKAPNPAH